MSGVVNIIQLSGVNPAAGPAFRTAAERALNVRADLIAWFDAKVADADGAGLITGIKSRRIGAGGVVQTIAPFTPTTGPSLVTTTDSQRGALMGLTSIGGSVISGEGNRALIGTSPFVLPNVALVPSAFTLCWLGVHSPTLNGTIFSTNDTGKPITLEFTSSGQARMYANRNGGSLLQGTAGDNNGALHLWSYVYDLGSGSPVVTIYRDGLVQKTGALALTAGYTDLSLRFGSTTTYASGTASPFNGMEGYMESAALFAGADAAARTAFKAVVAERHPGLTLA